MVFTVFREGCIFQNSSIQAPNLCRIYQSQTCFFDRKLMKNRSKIDIFEHSESDPILDRFWTPFWPYFGTIFGAFGVSWGPLAPILAARGPPRPLPRGLLGSLGVPKDLQTTILIDSGPTWSHSGGPGSHFGGPGLHFGHPEAPFWRPWGFILEALGPDRLPSLQTSKPQAWGRRNARSVWIYIYIYIYNPEFSNLLFTF